MISCTISCIKTYDIAYDIDGIFSLSCANDIIPKNYDITYDIIVVGVISCMISQKQL